MMPDRVFSLLCIPRSKWPLSPSADQRYTRLRIGDLRTTLQLPRPPEVVRYTLACAAMVTVIEMAPRNPGSTEHRRRTRTRRRALYRVPESVRASIAASRAPLPAPRAEPSNSFLHIPVFVARVGEDCERGGDREFIDASECRLQRLRATPKRKRRQRSFTGFARRRFRRNGRAAQRRSVPEIRAALGQGDDTLRTAAGRRRDIVQFSEERGFRRSAQDEKQKRVTVEFFADEVVRRRDVFAWICPVRTRAVRNSRSVVGKSDAPTSANASSISGGISPDKSLAAKRASLEMRTAIFRHVGFPSVATRIVTRYGRAREPCTRAVTRPAAMAMSRTCPARAYLRPRCRRAPISSPSRTAIQRFAHHCVPKPPRCARALIPPLVLRGLLGGGKRS